MERLSGNLGVASVTRSEASRLGFGNKEFARFSRIAKGSLEEVLNHMIDAYDQRLLSEVELAAHEHRIRKALKATIGLIRHLESSPDPRRPPKKKRDQDPPEPEPEP